MEKLNIKILDKRIGSSIELPKYATDGSAALDLRAIFDGDSISVAAGASVLIGSGIAIHIGDPNYGGLILPRSGLGHNHGLVLGNLVGLIDSDYQGELKISCWNRSAKTYTIELGERIAQLLIVPLIRPRLNVVQNFHDSARGAAGFGHSGRN